MKRERTTIGDLAQILGGGTPSTRVPEYWGGDIPWFTPAEIPKSGAGVVTTSERTITQAGLEHSAAKILPAGSVLMTSRASIGHCAIAGVPVATNQGFTSLVPKDCRSTRYLYYWAQYNRDKLLARASGSTFLEISASEVRDISIDPPALEEQRAIGDVLTSIDRLIRCLEQLIVKKQSVKQGMMQQLLTGRTRLPGFEEDWAPVRLRDVGTTYGGLVGKSKKDFGAGTAAFITFMEIMSDVRLRGKQLEQVHVAPGERQNQVKRNDILFNASSETPEEVALASFVDFDPSPSTYLNSFSFGYRLKAVDAIEPAYLAYYFRSDEGRMLVASLAQGATRYNISKTKLLERRPYLPPISEQQAIAAVLRNVDSEIDLLRERLGKARDMKTGMMQQLLTGRVRLPMEATV